MLGECLSEEVLLSRAPNELKYTSCKHVREKPSKEGTVSIHVLERKAPGMFHIHDK